MTLLEGIEKAYTGYANYVWDSITHPFKEGNFLFYFFMVSLVVWGLEVLFPWRKNQKPIRNGFWQDAFYLIFNSVLFPLLVFAALSSTTSTLFGRGMGAIGLPDNYVLDLSDWPQWVQMLLFFVLADFIQWLIHNLLHRVPFFWKFHKVHHSVREMGFAAHFRFHFMETFVYRVGLFVFLSYLFNFKLEYSFYMYAFTVLIGHLNHANIGIDYGPLKYVLNNPKMHIWHHAKHLPTSHPRGVNFGLTLSVWDYLFGTDYVPESGRDIELGFDDIETFPKDVPGQMIRPFKR